MQAVAQLRQEQRLAAERRDSGLLGLLFDIRPIVGRQDNDGHILPRLLPDPSDHLDTVHIRQQPVNNIYTIIITPHHCLTGTQNGLLS